MSDEEKKAKRRAYERSPEVKARNKIYDKKRSQLPEVREKRRLSEQRPDIKATRKAYKQTSKSKAQQKIYKQRPEVKARVRLNSNKPENKLKKKIYTHNYRQREDVKESIRLYRQQPEVKAKIRIYKRNYDQKNKEIIKLKRQEHNKIPEVRDRLRTQQFIYVQRPEVKDRKKLIRDLPENKLKKKLYNEQRGVKEKKKLYNEIHKAEKVLYDNKRRQIPEVRDRLNKSRIQRKKEDEGFNILCNLRSGFNKVLQHYSATGKIRSTRSYGVNFKVIIEYLGNKPNDGYEYHIDHIIPASWFNHNNPLEIKWCWSKDNLQWLRKELNLWKHNRFILPLSIEEQDILMKKLFTNKVKNN